MENRYFLYLHYLKIFLHYRFLCREIDYLVPSSIAKWARKSTLAEIFQYIEKQPVVLQDIQCNLFF
jgi:hypothetical protein